jgi:hypothetical protein
MKKFTLAVLSSLLISSIGAAGQLGGVTMPDTAQVSGKTLKLNGLGLRTKLFFKIYVAGLYLETPTHDDTQAITSEETKKVVMHFLYKKVTRKQLVDAWDDGFQDNSPAEADKLKGDISKFESWMVDMAAGQEMSFTYVPGIGTAVDVGGQAKGTIAGQDFARALLRVWLGIHPPTGELKAGMLGS